MSVGSDAVGAKLVAGVRLARLEDAARIAELSGQLGYPATAEEVERRLRQLEGDPQHVVFLAELRDAPKAGAIIGWVHVHEVRLVESDPRAEVSGLIVADGYQGRGAGRLLMEHAEQWARSRGFQTLLLRSNVIRGAAHAFYEKLGYEIVKSQKVFCKKL